MLTEFEMSVLKFTHQTSPFTLHGRKEKYDECKQNTKMKINVTIYYMRGKNVWFNIIFPLFVTVVNGGVNVQHLIMNF